MTWLTVLTERKPHVVNQDYARLVKGCYGKKFVVDEDGDEVAPHEKEKRSRGRPKKTDGINFEYTPEMMYCEMLWSGIDIDLLQRMYAVKGKK